MVQSSRSAATHVQKKHRKMLRRTRVQRRKLGK